MRPPHFLRPNRRSSQPSNFIFFDTETSLERQVGDLEIQKFRLGYASALRFDGKRQVRTSLLFYSPAEFADFIESRIRSKSHLYVFAHNLAFDLASTGIVSLLSERGWRLSRVFLEEGQTYLEMKREKRRISFIDSMNFFKCSLRELGEIVGLEKGRVDFAAVSDDELARYCRRDVEILERAILLLVEYLRKEDLGSLSITAASQAFRAFRHKYMRFRIALHDHPKATRLELDSYFGGRCECFYIGELRRPVWVFDVQSMYPYVMRENDYPTKLLAYGEGSLPVRSLHHLFTDYCLVGRVCLRTSEPVYPVRHEGKLIFPVGSFETCLTTPSLRYAYEHGHIDKVLALAVYKKAPLFREYVDDFWRRRLEFEKQGNYVFAHLTKLFLNSLYGKFGQRSYETEIWQADEVANDSGEFYFRKPDGSLYHCFHFAGQILAFHRKDEPSYNAFPAIASHVTDYARMYLWQLMKEAGLENVLYVDTDSLFVNEEGAARLQKFVKKGVLGALKLERQSSFIRIYTAKDYELEDIRRCKGRRLESKVLSDGVFLQDQFPSVKTVLKEKMNGYVVIKKVRKFYRRRYDKGIVTEEGRVLPYRFSSK